MSRSNKARKYTNDTCKQPLGTRSSDRAKLQQIMHYHGLEEFQQLLRDAYYDAADDTEDIDTVISEKYREAADHIEPAE